MQRQRGFTLLEIMVVLVIVSVLVTVVSLSAGQNPVKALEREAQKTQALIKLMQQESVIRGKWMAIHFENDGYQFLQQTPPADETDDDEEAQTEAFLEALSEEEQDALSGWEPIEGDDMLYPRVLPDNIRLSIIITEEEDESEEVSLFFEDKIELPPLVFLYPSGEMTEFELELRLDNEENNYYKLTGNLIGEVVVEGPF